MKHGMKKKDDFLKYNENSNNYSLHMNHCSLYGSDNLLLSNPMCSTTYVLGDLHSTGNEQGTSHNCR